MNIENNIVEKNKYDKDKIKEFLINNILSVILIIMVVVLSLSSSKFFTLINIENIFRQASFEAIVAVGMTMIIILGQIDLSVGSVIAFASVLNALLMTKGVPIPISMIITIVVSGLWGALNGWVTSFFKIHAFLVTLATMTLIRGVAYIMTGGYPIGGLSMKFLVLGSGTLCGIPLPIVYIIIIYLAFMFILRKTPFGRAIYAIGGNEEAARLSGLSISKVKILVFTIASALTGFAGIALSSRLLTGSPELGVGWELDVIAAVIIGGTNIFGGAGLLQKTLLGILFVAILANGMVLLNIDPYLQQVVKGALILGAVILNSIQRD